MESTLKRKNILPSVDRSREFADPDNEIVVTLENGHTKRFWLTGLSDEEYIRRARILEALT